MEKKKKKKDERGYELPQRKQHNEYKMFKNDGYCCAVTRKSATNCVNTEQALSTKLRLKSTSFIM